MELVAPRLAGSGSACWFYSSAAGATHFAPMHAAANANMSAGGGSTSEVCEGTEKGPMPRFCLILASPHHQCPTTVAPRDISLPDCSSITLLVGLPAP